MTWYELAGVGVIAWLGAVYTIICVFVGAKKVDERRR